MVVVYGRWRGSEVIKNMNEYERIPDFENCKPLVQIPDPGFASHNDYTSSSSN